MRLRTEYTKYKASDHWEWTVNKLLTALKEAKRLNPNCDDFEVTLLGGSCPDVVVDDGDDSVTLGRT